MIVMKDKDSLGRWLQGRCKSEHLSLREAGAKTGLSHSTIRDIIKGTRPLLETIEKLAGGFGGDGSTALEDHLLLLVGYRTQQPDEPSWSLVELMDKVKGFSEPQLSMMNEFADFLAEIEKETRNKERAI